MKLLFATDGSKPAQSAAQFLGALLLPEGTTLDVLVVTEALNWLSPDWLKESQWRAATDATTAARKLLERDGIEVKEELREGQPAYEILCAAEKMQADLIVVGSEGRTGVRGFLIGSVARSVAQNASQPVLVARAPRAGLRAAVLAIDGSDHASRAVELAASLPLPSATEWVVSTVVRPFSSFGLLTAQGAVATDEMVEVVQEQRRREAGALLQKARAQLEAAGRRVTTVVMEGDPATAILDLAGEHEADLIIAGARGDSLVRRLALGSVADRLLKTARCSVLVAR
jgi:nucleotide-binding universal stress UspA family protein